jgi:hypothetical protein
LLTGNLLLAIRSLTAVTEDGWLFHWLLNPGSTTASAQHMPMSRFSLRNMFQIIMLNIQNMRSDTRFDLFWDPMDDEVAQLIGVIQLVAILHP